MAEPADFVAGARPSQRRRSIAMGAALFAAAIFSLLRVAHRPSRWGLTQYLFTYEHGFAKRALFGEFLRLFLGDHRYHLTTLVGVALTVTSIFVAGIVLLSARRRNPFGFFAVLGPAGVFTYQYCGYLEQIFYLVVGVAAALILWRPNWRRVIIFTTAVLTIFMHEAAFFMVAPLLVFAGVMARYRAEKRPLRWRELVFELAPLLPLFVLAMLVADIGTMTPHNIDLLRADIQARADFPPRLDGIDVLVRTSAANAAIMKELWRTGVLYSALYDAMPLGIVFIGVVLMGLVRVMRQSTYDVPLELGVGIFATVAPLFLSLIGWDLDRWAELAIINGFACICLAAESLLAPGETLSWPLPRSLFAVVLVLALSEPYPARANLRIPIFSGFFSDLRESRAFD